MVGSSPSPYTSDFTLGSSTGVTPADFADQHHATVDAAGDLMIWDNRSVGTSPTRALRITVDPAGGVADMVEEWSAGEWCPGRGSAFLLPNGNILGDCSPENRVVEIEDVTSRIVLSLHATCVNEVVPSFLMRRAVPVVLFPQNSAVSR